RRSGVEKERVAVGAVPPATVADRKVATVGDDPTAAACRALEVAHPRVDPRAHFIRRPPPFDTDRVGRRAFVMLLDEAQVVLARPAADRDLRRQEERVDLLAETVRRE